MGTGMGRCLSGPPSCCHAAAEPRGTAGRNSAKGFFKNSSRYSHPVRDPIGVINPPRRPYVSAPIPPHLAAVLDASDDVTRSRAWAAFLDQYSALLLKVARRTAPSHDGAMDRYAFILDQLRDEGCRRLRAFAADGRGKFTTWLVVVARRLCVDHHRRTHGRVQAEQESNPTQALEHVARRNLVDFIAAEIDLEQMRDGTRPHPDAEVLRKERRTALRSVVATLNVADQLLLTLRFEDNVPLNKIGPMIGLRSRFQVHRRLTAVLARLKDGLEAHGITEP